MSIKEISVKDEQPHRAWEMDISGKKLIMERYGSFCGWESIEIKKNGKPRYKIALSSKRSSDKEDIGEREEFFFGKSFRNYSGNRFSFVEYAWNAAEKGTIPGNGEFSGYLDSKTESQYRKLLRKILKG